MWIVWLEFNCCSFEDKEKTLDELKVLCHRSLLEWSSCWDFTDCSSLFDCFFKFFLFIIMNFWGISVNF